VTLATFLPAAFRFGYEVRQRIKACSLRADQSWSRSRRAGVDSAGIYDLCRSRSRTQRWNFEWKPDPELEQEWEFQLCRSRMI